MELSPPIRTIQSRKFSPTSESRSAAFFGENMTEKENREGLGALFMWVGFFLCLTVFGAIRGIPMMYAGFKAYNGIGEFKDDN